MVLWNTELVPGVVFIQTLQHVLSENCTYKVLYNPDNSTYPKDLDSRQISPMVVLIEKE